jgi:hypothetical protein
MAAIRTMKKRRGKVFTRRNFLRAAAAESGLDDGGVVGAARKGSIGGV